MTKDALRDAIAEARRFIAKAERAKFHTPDWGPKAKAPDVVGKGKSAAAIRRASLDLCESLIALRKSGLE